jgi:hypothetical protein
MSKQYKPMKEHILHGYYYQTMTHEVCDVGWQLLMDESFGMKTSGHVRFLPLLLEHYAHKLKKVCLNYNIGQTSLQLWMYCFKLCIHLRYQPSKFKIKSRRRFMPITWQMCISSVLSICTYNNKSSIFGLYFKLYIRQNILHFHTLMLLL